MSALDAIETPSPASPSLRIFDHVPPGHIVFAVRDDSCLPLARRGEVLVVEDEPRSIPEEGHWYLIQWITQPHHEWERATVRQTVGIPRELKPNLWGYSPPCRYAGGMHYAGDSGFTFMQMCDYLRGPVVGIYRPSAKARIS